MRNNTSTKILDKINVLEKELQKLKLEAYFNLPRKKEEGIYPEASLRKAIQKTRETIWQKRYAKKV